MKHLIIFALLLTNIVYAANVDLTEIKSTEVLSNKEVRYDLNKLTAVIFVSAKCPCSQSHMEHLQTLKKKHPEVQFIGILSNADETSELAKSVLQKFEFPLIMDTHNQLANKFGAIKTPHAFVIKNKEILYHGGVSDSSNFKDSKRQYLAKALEQIKNNQKPNPETGKALGCGIKRR